MFWQLYRKEMKAQKGNFLVLAGIAAIWIFFLYTRLGIWPHGAVAGLAWMPVGFLPLWTIWKAIHLYRQEWSENTSYLMLSLPVRGWQIGLSKLAALITELVGYGLIMLIGGLWMLRATGFTADFERILAATSVGWMFEAGLKVILAGVFGLVVLALLAQLAFLVSRMFDRFQGLILALTLFLGMWLMQRFTTIVGSWLLWLPDFTLRGPSEVNGVIQMQTLIVESGPVFAAMLFSALVIWGINWYLESAEV